MWFRSHSISTNDRIHVLFNTNSSLQDYIWQYFVKNLPHRKGWWKSTENKPQIWQILLQWPLSNKLLQVLQLIPFLQSTVTAFFCQECLCHTMAEWHPRVKNICINSARYMRWSPTTSKVNTIWGYNNEVGMSPRVVYFLQNGKRLLQQVSWRSLYLQKWWISISGWVTEWSCLKWHYTGYLWQSVFNFRILAV
jgi:hypothetical protein